MFYHNIHFFDPQTAFRRATLDTFAHFRRSVARSVRSFFAPCPLQKQPVARLPCVFRLQNPLSKNDGMQQTYIFVDFVCHRLLSLSFHCFTHHLLQFFDYFLLFASHIFKKMLLAAAKSTFFKILLKFITAPKLNNFNFFTTK